MRALALLLLSLAFAAPVPALAQDKAPAAQTDTDVERLEAARTFARASGMWNAILADMDELGSIVTTALQDERPDMGADQAEAVRRVVDSHFTARQGELLDAVSGVLARYLEVSDLNALIAYFETVPGRAQAGMIGRGSEISVEDLAALVMGLPADQRAQVEAFGESQAALNWLDAQPRFMEEVEEVSNRFGENLIIGAAPEIRAILNR
ncbi:MAG: hypothetical protein ACQRW7_11845 [Caulobacterales bacterium]|uniref:hypothetical protein n=1 Tax=Glycocaulis sp. TaxID=1969725 RepID=UPI003FA00515